MDFYKRSQISHTVLIICSSGMATKIATGKRVEKNVPRLLEKNDE